MRTGWIKDRLSVWQRRDGRWIVTDPDRNGIGLSFRDRSGAQHTVAPGFVTDFASVPAIFRAVVPRWSKSAKAAVVHDWLYRQGTTTRKQADNVFHEALRASGVSRVGAWLMWAGVRLGGGWAWRRARRDDK